MASVFFVEAPKRNFLRRTTTKATAAPETTTASTDNTETTTNTSSPPVNRFNRRGNSKFKPRKELEKSVEKNEIETVSRRPSLNGVAQRNGPPANRKFISRRRLGGANATTVSTTTPVPTASTTRRPNRLLNRRRPSSTTTTIAPTTTTEATTTKLYEDEDSLQEIGDTDAIEDPTLEPRKPKISTKVQRRPLILKDPAADQNPSATNEDENKRQSKKYSASIKQNQLDDLVKRVSEESSTERRTTTVEDISPETAVALAAHQLITAPVPIVTDFEDDDIKPTRKIQTTVEYKYTSREYNEYTNDDSRTPSYEYQSTPIYKSNTLGSDDVYKTQTDFDSTKASDFDAHRTTLQKYPTTPEYKTIDYVQTTKSDSYTDFGSPKISTYDVKSTHYPSIDQDYTRTTITEYTEPEFDAPKSTSTPFASKTISINIPTNTVTGNIFGDSTTDLYTRLTDFLPKSDYRNTITQDYTRTSAFPETSTGFVSKNSYVPNFSSSTYPNTAIEENEPQSRISTTLSPLPTSRKPFGRTTATLAENSARIVSGFTPRATEATKLRKGFSSDLSANAVTGGYSGVQRGSSKFREEKLISVPVEDGGYSTVGYSGSSQEPSYFTREYLLESPVTKTYDEEFQYLSPITTPQVPTPSVTRRVIRKKIQRKISTTQRPTTTTTTTPSPPQSTTTVVPRRVPAKPFEKVPKEKKKYRPIANYDYYDEGVGTLGVKYEEGTKVVMHENGNIECLDIGNFPHPTSCKKFISCARIDNGSLLGWEYVCPKGLSFDPVGGICNWSAGLGCKE